MSQAVLRQSHGKKMLLSSSEVPWLTLAAPESRHRLNVLLVLNTTLSHHLFEYSVPEWRSMVPSGCLMHISMAH